MGTYAGDSGQYSSQAAGCLHGIIFVEELDKVLCDTCGYMGTVDKSPHNPVERSHSPC